MSFSINPARPPPDPLAGGSVLAKQGVHDLVADLAVLVDLLPEATFEGVPDFLEHPALGRIPLQHTSLQSNEVEVLESQLRRGR